jgi:hypothetical protein
MTTIFVDPDDGGTQAGTMLPPPAGWKPTPISDRLGEPIDAEAGFVLRNGEPCLLFGNWDYGEDWSGEFVRETHPFSLIGEGCVKVTPEGWWAVVRRTHGG